MKIEILNSELMKAMKMLGSVVSPARDKESDKIEVIPKGDKLMLVAKSDFSDVKVLVPTVNKVDSKDSFLFDYQEFYSTVMGSKEDAIFVFNIDPKQDSIKIESSQGGSYSITNLKLSSYIRNDIKTKTVAAIKAEDLYNLIQHSIMWTTNTQPEDPTGLYLYTKSVKDNDYLYANIFVDNEIGMFRTPVKKSKKAPADIDCVLEFRHIAYTGIKHLDPQEDVFICTNDEQTAITFKTKKVAITYIGLSDYTDYLKQVDNFIPDKLDYKLSWETVQMEGITKRIKGIVDDNINFILQNEEQGRISVLTKKTTGAREELNIVLEKQPSAVKRDNDPAIKFPETPLVVTPHLLKIIHNSFPDTKESVIQFNIINNSTRDILEVEQGFIKRKLDNIEFKTGFSLNMDENQQLSDDDREFIEDAFSIEGL